MDGRMNGWMDGWMDIFFLYILLIIQKVSENKCEHKECFPLHRRTLYCNIAVPTQQFYISSLKYSFITDNWN